MTNPNTTPTRERQPIERASYPTTWARRLAAPALAATLLVSAWGGSSSESSTPSSSGSGGKVVTGKSCGSNSDGGYPSEYRWLPHHVCAASAEKIADALISARWPGAAEKNAYNKLITRESSEEPDAINTSSSACGMVQALPCSKIENSRVDKNGNGIIDVNEQVEWQIAYIASRPDERDPIGAWDHELADGWY